MYKKITNLQNEVMSKHLEEVQNTYLEMRSWKHDYHNHIQIMKAYIELDEIDKLKEYLDGLFNEIINIDKVIKSGNILVDALLNSKSSLATKKGISVKMKALVPNELMVSEIDLCVILGNLLDNAIDECMRLDGDRFIRVYIGMKNTQLYACVTNSSGKKKIKKGSIFSSMKGTLHGFGLSRVENTVRKYKGYCSFNSEDGAFTAEVMLPMAAKDKIVSDANDDNS
jgi:sensor histidine kinase regulating citrate/malate metabolism